MATSRRAVTPSLAPALRVTAPGDRPVGPGRYVLYWMIAARRTRWSFALDHALARAAELDLPLVVFEPLRAGYAWASDRLHQFVIDGMRAQAARLSAAGITYLPYLEPTPGAGRGLLAALATDAALVVTDEYPVFFLPHMVAAAARRLPCRLEQVDGTGLLPLRATGQDFPTAIAFRRHLQRTLPPHLADRPRADPLAALAPGLRAGEVAGATLRRWPMASAEALAGGARTLAALPIDHAVAPVPGLPGGEDAARAACATFLDQRLDRYGEDRNQPDDDVASGLSPYLHFGHLGVHDVVDRIFTRHRWDPARLAGVRTTGYREGWWQLPAATEGFLDELVTWRELGHVFAHHRRDYDQYESLPGWAQATLDKHAADPRPHLYSTEALEAAATHDPLWNAAQRQLVVEGKIHNYLRMLWGKKILEWSASPRAALAALIHLNNKYAVDGRDPNSYSGIFWTLGRFDRPWPPERPIFGNIRYMSSANTARKLRVKGYLERWSTGQRSLF